MGCAERIGNLNPDLHQPRTLQGPARDERVQALPVNQFHNQEAHTAFTPDIVNSDDVRVVECGERARLLSKSLTPLIFAYLQGDQAIEATISRFPDFAHCARPDRRDQFVWSEPVSSSQRHGR